SSPSTDPSATDPTSPGGASRTGETPRAARGRRRRLDTVLDLVIDNGHISVEALVAQLGISPATARRDLDALADPQLLIRSHGGTTTTALAHELASRQDFRDCERATVLVTNAVNIAQELAVRRHLQLVVTGGVVRESSYELVGTWAEQMLAQIRIDTMFIGVN